MGRTETRAPNERAASDLGDLPGAGGVGLERWVASQATARSVPVSRLRGRPTKCIGHVFDPIAVTVELASLACQW
jgi:hypothetical protein